MKEDKPRIIERICRRLDIMPESISRTPYIELHGRTLLKIRDGGRILLYTPERIRIALARGGGTIMVIGSGLSCSFYNMGAVGIEGNIDTLTFVCEEDEG